MSFSASLPKAAIDQLKGFITLCKAKPEVLHNPDLAFFHDYLNSLGANIPPKPKEERKPMTKEEMASASPSAAPEDDEMEVESEESDVDLDMEGVLSNPDEDTAHDMGDASKKEMSDEEMEKFDEKRSEAMSTFSEGEWEKAIALFSEAIQLNPNSAAMFAKRGAAYIKIQKPNACVRDCTRAIELNPDNAGAYKFRGRAHRLLGNFTDAAKDLATACKIDFDEQADEWLKEVQPNAKKLTEHQRKKDRKDAEKQLAEKKDRIKKAKEAREAAAKHAAENPQDDEMGDMGGLGGLFNDPEMMAAFADPEVAAAFKDISANPANIMKYQSNPKVMALVNKMASKFGGGGGMGGGMPGMGGMGGLGGMAGMAGMMGGLFGGGGPSASAPPPASAPAPAEPSKPPTSTDDLD
jgi:suppressor of tumorigenicity protein 13